MLTAFETILIILAIVVLLTTIFRRFNIPSIVGYIIVGVLVGPNLLAWITDGHETRAIAEFGVVFLLFTIGLEFSLPRLIAMRSIVFGLGALQVVVTALTISLLGVTGYFTFGQALVIGAIIAMSSTAIVTKQLSEQLEIATESGLHAVGVLLFQDLAVIPLIILVSMFKPEHAQSLGMALLWALIKGFIAIVFILSAGRFLLKPLFLQITRYYSLELLTLTVLLIALGSAWVTHEMGLSFALGSFFAGMMLGETEFRHQIEVVISPFRDVLLALFFISVGMQLNPMTMIHEWSWVLMTLLGLIIIKAVIMFVLSLLFGANKIVSFRTSLLLAQAGEFGLVLLLLASSTKLLPDLVLQIILSGMLLSMLISPIFINFNARWANALFGKKNENETLLEQETHLPDNTFLREHVIICGYGRVGQNIAKILDSQKIPFIAFDLDSVRVQEAKLAGDQVFYADASNHAILELAGISRAKALVVSFKEKHHVLKILEMVRSQNKRIPILVRSEDESDVQAFYEAGATEVISELFETSMIFATHLLVFFHQSLGRITKVFDKIRRTRYALLQGVFAGSTALTNDDEAVEKQMQVVMLTEDAFAINKNLTELNLKELGVTLSRVRRGNKQHKEFSGQFRLQSKDVLVLVGFGSDLLKAERLLLEGK